MAHKKGQGSVRNGRDSNAKHRGIKKYAGESVTTGSIIVLQCGTKWHPGANVKRASNDTLFAMCDGTVYFSNNSSKVNVKPLEVAAASA
ncbi:50S ribosomal protein L27 [Limnoglobus roseus]|uniref:Large ribosomal subunit protein bL27 n=1 Tax=Limnoglobus roseus TaxID=2598579 RepID=A0A5C1A6W1_9BACT|nr:50S ribosomal protein L27 [Limnoglobus roseus]QEL13993.1 50S ribosomal protein L27 [Limnoglobus roseus]